MRSLLSYFLGLTKRWARVIVLCMIVCGGITFVITTLTPKVYTAETTLGIIIGGVPQYEPPQSEIAILYTLSQLIKKDVVLQPVAARHHLTVAQLKDMVTTKPQSNTLTVLIDVDNNDAVSAVQLSYEVTRAFVDYAINQTETAIQFNIIKPTVPVNPSMPHPTQSALLGTLAGLVLSLAALTTSEWINDKFPQRN